MSDPPSTADGAALDDATQRRAVRERYGSIAGEADSCCGETASCREDDRSEAPSPSRLGYEAGDVADAETAAALSLGCGNPTALAGLEAGETVLDLGSGGGFDCFLAAREVGPEGRVIGVDMTPEMVAQARETRAETDADNVEFRLGEIEHLPVADATVDTVISNCVVNLSPSKPQVFREVVRVLAPGGHLAISDVVRTANPPSGVRADLESLTACVAGAATIPDLERMLRDAGFTEIQIEPDDESDSFIRDWDSERDLSDYIVAATIEARKPADA